MRPKRLSLADFRGLACVEQNQTHLSFVRLLSCNATDDGDAYHLTKLITGDAAISNANFGVPRCDAKRLNSRRTGRGLKIAA